MRSRLELCIFRPWIPGLLLCPLAMTGCQPGARRDAESLSKQSVAAASLFSDYQASIVTDYERYNADVDFTSPSSATVAGRHASSALADALQERADLAASLKRLADQAASVLDFKADDAKAAAKALQEQIEAVNHHPLKYPTSLDPFVPAADKDPGEALGKAVQALVEFQALRDYRRSLPKLREAVAAVDAFFDDERVVYTYFAANHPAYDSYVVESATAAGMTIDFTALQPAFDTFGMKLLPSKLSKDGQAFRPNLLRSRSAVVRNQAVATAMAGARVSKVLFGLDMALVRAAKIPDPGAPFYSAKELSDGDVGTVVLAMQAAKDGKEPSSEPTARILKQLAKATSKEEWAALRGSRSASLVRDKLNVVVGGGSLYPTAIAVYGSGKTDRISTKKDQEDARNLVAYDSGTPQPADVPDEVKASLDLVAFLDAAEFNPPPSSTYTAARFVPYYLVLPPAGRAAAELNRRLVDTYLLKRSKTQ